jgi:hypothetical protein
MIEEFKLIEVKEKKKKERVCERIKFTFNTFIPLKLVKSA